MSDLAGWWIVFAHGRTLVGKLVSSSTSYDGRLEPVYELAAAMVPTPNGQMALMRQASPVCTFASVRGVDLPPGLVSIPVDSLDSSERRALAQCVAGAEQLVQAMRAQASGIVIAPANTRLP